MTGTITEDRANIIANAILTDGNGCGGRDWLERHFIGHDELGDFLDAAVEHARLLAYATRADMSFSTHKGKVGSTTETWSVAIPHKHTDNVLAVAESGIVTALLIPGELTEEAMEQLSLPFDPDTGEVLDC